VLAATRADDACLCIGTGTPTSVNQIYQQLCAQLGVTVEPRHAPRRPGDLLAAYFDVSLARERLGWVSEVSLGEGISRTVEYIRAQVGGCDQASGAA